MTGQLQVAILSKEPPHDWNTARNLRLSSAEAANTRHALCSDNIFEMQVRHLTQSVALFVVALSCCLWMHHLLEETNSFMCFKFDEVITWESYDRLGFTEVFRKIWRPLCLIAPPSPMLKNLFMFMRGRSPSAIDFIKLSRDIWPFMKEVMRQQCPALISVW